MATDYPFGFKYIIFLILLAFDICFSHDHNFETPITQESLWNLPVVEIRSDNFIVKTHTNNSLISGDLRQEEQTILSLLFDESTDDIRQEGQNVLSILPNETANNALRHEERNISSVEAASKHNDVRPEWELMLDNVATVIVICNLVTLMLGMGCATNWRQVASHLWPPKGIIIGMASQFVFLPACGTLISWVFGLTPFEAMGVLIICCSPGGAFSNFFTFWVDGDLPLSIVMTTCSSMLAFVGMPFNLWLYSKVWDSGMDGAIAVPYVVIAKSLLFISIPVLVGMTVRHFREKLAKKLTMAASLIGWVGVVSAWAIYTVLYWRIFLEASSFIFLAGGLLPAVGFSFGFFFARIFCMTNQSGRTIGIETGCQNMPVAISIIAMSYDDPQVKGSMMLFPSVYATFQMLEILVFIAIFQGLKRRRLALKNGQPTMHRPTVIRMDTLPGEEKAIPSSITC